MRLVYTLVLLTAVGLLTVSIGASDRETSTRDCQYNGETAVPPANAELQELLAARTVFVRDDGGPAANGGDTLDALRRELQLWQQWTEVSAAHRADVILAVQTIRGEAGVSASLAVRSGATDAVLWTTNGPDYVTVLQALKRQVLPCADMD